MNWLFLIGVSSFSADCYFSLMHVNCTSLLLLENELVCLIEVPHKTLGKQHEC